MKAHIEWQIQHNGAGQFFLVITISRFLSRWVSPPAFLNAKDWPSAFAESAEQIKRLSRTLGASYPDYWNAQVSFHPDQDVR